MYRFIRFKKRKLKRTEDITLDIYLREKRNKFSNKTKDKYLNRNKHIVLQGLEGAGKSRELIKLRDYSMKIWKEKKVFYIRAIDTIKEIVENNITTAELKKYLEENNLTKKDLNKTIVRIELMQHYIKNNVLLIDDIDKFTGKKLEFLKELLKQEVVIVCTCKDYNAINKTIQQILKKKEVQLVTLNTKASYDATYVLFVVFVLFVAALGQPELAFLIIAGRYMLKGIEK